MLSYTTKFILWGHDKNEVGQCPIYLQITVNRKTSYISTGHFIFDKFWDEKNMLVKNSLSDAKTINPELTHLKNKLLQRIVELQVKNIEFTAKGLKAFLTDEKGLNNIFAFVDNFCIEVKHKRKDLTIEVYENHSRKLEKFHGSRELNFEDITPGYLARYEKHLRDSGAHNNYVHGLFKTLKTFFNAAKKKKIIDFYPFNEYENPIYKDPQKDYLTLDELKAWEKFADETDNRVYKETSVYFLLGCYSGLRISDWKAFDIKTHVVDNTIKLRATKNNEWLAIPLNGPMARNIERMRLLPLTIEEPTLNEKLKIIAKKLGINKKLSSHSGRKTFAVTMCADMGVSLEVCATLMGITVIVCFRNYYKVTPYKINKEVTNAWKDL